MRNLIQNCLAATRLISKGQHQKLNTYERLSLSVHLKFCKYCNSFEQDLDYLKTQLHQMNEKESHYLKEDYKQELQKIVLAAMRK